MKRVIVSAENTSGTTWYEITAQDILKNATYAKNIWIKYKLENYPLDECINLYYMDGSKVYDNILYYCDTDYAPILIDGEEVDPIDALDLFDLEDISEYISKNTPPSISGRFTDDDFEFRNNEIDRLFEVLISEYPAKQVIEDGEDLGFDLEYEKEHLSEYLN